MMWVKNMNIDYIETIQKFDSILERGLCRGLGKRDGQLCVESALCAALDLPHSDDPGCIAASVRGYATSLNDAPWSSPAARARGMRDLGIAQIGSLGIVNEYEFVKRLTEKTIRELIPKLFRRIFPANSICLIAADRCEREGSYEAATIAEAETEGMVWAGVPINAVRAALEAVRITKFESQTGPARAAMAAATAITLMMAEDVVASAIKVAARAIEAKAFAEGAEAREAARAAVWARIKATEAESDSYLLLSAKLALETLQELSSPGCKWIGMDIT